MLKIVKKIQAKLLEYFPRFGIDKEVDYFLENLSSLLSAGIPVLDAFYSVEEEVHSNRLKRIVKQMRKKIESGISLSDTLMDSGLFSPHVSMLIKLGEKSGRLVENLKIISIEEGKRRALTSKIRSAVLYPAFVVSLTLIIGVGISWFILPKLTTVFSQLKVKLPLVTKMLVAFGAFMNDYGIIAVPLFFIIILTIIYFVFFFHKTKKYGEGILFAIPGISTLLKQSEITRFGYLLGTLLKAGLSPNEALYSLAEATSFIRYRSLYTHLATCIGEGNSFKKSFALYKNINKLLPISTQQLIMAGEQSGSLSDTLIKISETYDVKTDTTAKDLAVMLEPILLLIVWFGVVGVALAVILPIYSLVGQLH